MSFKKHKIRYVYKYLNRPKIQSILILYTFISCYFKYSIFCQILFITNFKFNKKVYKIENSDITIIFISTAMQSKSSTKKLV